MPRGSRRLPEECVRRLAVADLVLHAGDVVSRAFLDELRSLGPRVEAVHGNADEAELRSILPKDLVVEVEGIRIGMTHVPGPSRGREERLLSRFPGCDAVVYGHTHEPRVELASGIWLLNPGSPTERRRSPSRSMLEIRVEAARILPTLVTFDP